MGTTLATYYARLQDMPDSEYKVETWKTGQSRRLRSTVKYTRSIITWAVTPFIRLLSTITRTEYRFLLLPIISYTIMNKGELYQIELQGEMERIHNARSAAESVGRQVVQAPMPGVILKTYVKRGDSVKRGDPLCVLVAMKMENEIRSVTDGVVKEVFVEDGMKVGLNDRIMVIE